MSSEPSKTILVTGANKGIGYHAARILSEKYPSTTILMGSRSVENANSALNKLRSSSTGHSYTNIIPLQIDVSDPASIQRAKEEVQSKYGTLDILVNNAGIATNNATEVFDVNVHGVKRTIDAFQPILSKRSTRTPQNVVVSSEVGAWVLHEMNPELQAVFQNIDTLTWEKLDSLMKDFASSSPKESWPSAELTFGPYGVSKTVLSAYIQLYAKQHPEIGTVNVTPGYCATDLNQNSGPRSAAVGGESCVWPILNDGWEQGALYMDGEKVEYNHKKPW
ncbi:hypothetical protein HDV00_011493 [Rhizophlyctis rosea]|nr:hypothetical protein HDV00_011493 [Rhizophlyctis rosea]